MTPEQVVGAIAAIVALLGGGQTIKWAVGAIVGAISRSGEAMLASAKVTSEALLAASKETAAAAREAAVAATRQAGELASMRDQLNNTITKIDNIHDFVERFTPQPDEFPSLEQSGERRVAQTRRR